MDLKSCFRSDVTDICRALLDRTDANSESEYRPFCMVQRWFSRMVALVSTLESIQPFSIRLMVSK